MSELSADARELVEAARESDGPALRDKTRVKERLMRQLGVGAFAGAAAVSVVRSAASSSSAPSLTRVTRATSKPAAVATRSAGAGAPWLKSLGKVAMAATAAGALYSGVTLIGDDAGRQAAPRRVEQLQPAPPPALEPIIEPLVDTQPQEVPPEALAGAGPAHRSESRHTRRQRGGAASAAPDSLAQELSLLARAQRSLRQEDPRAALAIVQEHTARFPAGSLQEERSGIEALARCRLGDSDADSVQAFLKRSPSSPLAARVRKECGSRR